jgi:hypothetical protein
MARMGAPPIVKTSPDTAAMNESTGSCISGPKYASTIGKVCTDSSPRQNGRVQDHFDSMIADLIVARVCQHDRGDQCRLVQGDRLVSHGPGAGVNALLESDEKPLSTYVCRTPSNY